jgi:hypothetical protein
MLKTILIALLPFAVFFGDSSKLSLFGLNLNARNTNTGTLEKMIVSSGNVELEFNLNASDLSKQQISTQLRFDVNSDSFFTVLVYNNELRGPLPSSMSLISKNSANLPSKLSESYRNLVFENTPWGDQYEFVIRDKTTGFVFFNVEGHEYDYNPNGKSLGILNGRTLISKEFADELGNAVEAGTIVGKVSVRAEMKPIEVTEIVDGDVKSNVIPAANPEAGTVPGPDVVVGDLTGLAQFGSSMGTQVGLSVGTDSCNFGTVDLNWFAMPNNDHPVIPQNLYRMSGGANNDERFEQIGQSSVKHGFTALTNNICNLGCNGVGGTRLGSGCSDPYSASLNSGPNLGSRAWINPFTGSFPRGDSTTPSNTHTGHAHNGTSHRILTEISDLNTTLNVGATYYAESQYITPHEYNWCQTNPTQCNMYNNVSYRRYNVTGTGSPFSFSSAAATMRAKIAVSAWTGATMVEIRPEPGIDGIGTISYKVTNPSPGVWHYEYAVYNQNLDRGIQSFSIPLGSGVTLSNVGFRSPPQHPGSPLDGTFSNAGFSNAAWAQSQASGSMTWSSETFAVNPNANAIRWGTMYNFRFDSNRPPQAMNATVGFYKTGSPITATVQGPSSSAPSVSVTVSGRVTTSLGRAVSNARVSITDPTSVVRTTMTNPSGYYRFNNVLTGGVHTVGVTSKRYTFTSQTMQINDTLSGVNFVSTP